MVNRYDLSVWYCGIWYIGITNKQSSYGDSSSKSPTTVRWTKLSDGYSFLFLDNERVLQFICQMNIILTAEHLLVACVPCICKAITEETFLFPNSFARSWNIFTSFPSTWLHLIRTKSVSWNDNIEIGITTLNWSNICCVCEYTYLNCG